VPAVDAPPSLDEIEAHRKELTGYCYRMLGSSFEAEDAVQEAMVRAWKASDRFEGRSSLRSWLYRIATNVCLDAIEGRQKRALPVDLGPASRADGHVEPPTGEADWVGPVPDARIGDPAEVAAARETIRLAFVAALQHLPARQRAVLVLREVLRWQATEVAELLDTTVASVNSALQRARATLDSVAATPDTTPASSPEEHAELLDRYVDAFERYDVAELVSLLKDDVEFSMPPFPMWLNTAEDVGKWFVGPGAGCEGSRILRTTANGVPALAQYRVDPAGGWAPWSIQVLTTSGGEITSIINFLDMHDRSLFAEFGLPVHLDA
jgi:RNA polymerase sigma-70 factor (ECF subfamily)